MTKSNPLFVDSTRLHGDRIDTQIELNKVLLYDGEILSVLITNHQGECDRVEMIPGDDSYHAKVWLNHQKPVSYRFVVEKDGQRLWRSEIRQARAQYAIIENWEPWEGEDEVLPVTPPPSVPLRNAASPAESNMGGVASLIDKWGL